MVNWLIRLYNASLWIYPRVYHEEFAEEMRETFARAVEEAQRESVWAVFQLCWYELAGLMPGLGRAYQLAWRERAKARPRGAQGSALEGSWRELLLALAVFLLPAVTGFVNEGPGGFNSLGLPATVLFLVVMLLLGWLGGFPLWSLPYIGIMVVIAGYLHLFQWVAALTRPAFISSMAPGPWERETYLLLEVVSTGMVWLMLFCLTLLVVALLAVFNRFQPLLARLRQDWTMLSYILYGESVFALVVLFGSHRSDPNYAIASLLFLLGGVWFYLRSQAGWPRLMALVSCLSLAVAVAALDLSPGTAGRWLSWDNLQLSEAARLLLSWIFMVAALLLPGLLTRYPSKGSTVAGPLTRGQA